MLQDVSLFSKVSHFTSLLLSYERKNCYISFLVYLNWINCHSTLLILKFTNNSSPGINEAFVMLLFPISNIVYFSVLMYCVYIGAIALSCSQSLTIVSHRITSVTIMGLCGDWSCWGQSRGPECHSTYEVSEGQI